MYGSLLSSCTAFNLCTLLDTHFLSEAISITSSLSISILDSPNCLLLITTSDHSTAILLFTPSITLGLPSYPEVIGLLLNWIKSQYHLGYILLDKQIKIDYVANPNYKNSKTRQIKVNCLLNQIYEFK